MVKDATTAHATAKQEFLLNGIPRFKKPHFIKSQFVPILYEKLNLSKNSASLKIEYSSDGLSTGLSWLSSSSSEDLTSTVSSTALSLLSLSISKSGGNKKLDRAFPYLHTDKDRGSVKLDPVAYYSLTPYYAAIDMRDVCLAVLNAMAPAVGNDLVAADYTAGAGGNTISFLHSPHFSSVYALEIDKNRAEDLKFNIALTCSLDAVMKSQIIVEDCTRWKPPFLNAIDLVFIDPPFGGQEYTKQTSTSDYILGTTSLSTLIHEFTGVRVCAVKVPSFFNAADLFKVVTRAGEWSVDGEGLDERPHPFRIQFGAKLALLVIAYPPFTNNKGLDGIISALKEMDCKMGGVLHPKYFDWEMQEYVSVKRWRSVDERRVNLKQ